jgi:branched-chain amino acid aminotransferase
MSHYLIYNGELLRNDKPLLTADNRGFRYGDGLFETLRVTGSNIRLAAYHFERLFNGLQLLQFELPSFFKPQYLSDQIELLCDKNGHASARIRLAVFRGNGDVFDPENHFPNTIIQSMPLADERFMLNENGLVTGIYSTATKNADVFANLKSNNYLPYTMAALYSKQQQWNEALLLNNAGRICDATIANVFIVKNDKISTPALGEGCVGGVMRRWLIEQLPLAGYVIEERQITVDDILQADEIFLTNAIKGVRWVQQCDKSKYNNRIAKAIYNDLLKNQP